MARNCSNGQDKYLSIYLRDHHAAGCAGVRLATRLATNLSVELRSDDELSRVAEEVAADLGTLERFMKAEGVSPSEGKDTLAIVAGRLGGLKPNGHLRERSPLSDLIELETLLVGITGKACLWASLAERRPADAVELQSLRLRAQAQAAVVSRYRDEASTHALGQLPG